ncbi:MAG: amidohydrolase family protein [Candidatus Tectomicrobia bacterium]|uniref:Amidohydrolase family protein n=1 Tax=Tectimicrobiota bacterium TaxID=2528274 RepID=A0A932HY17_UNCTE|nr:amidohydrolase family protein [Candidatus Tectomicrobia bacterium]
MAAKPAPRPLDRLLAGGTLVSGHGRQEASIGFRDGRVAWIGRPEEAPPAAEALDVSGRLVLPGAVDPHAHFRAFSSHIDTLADTARSAAHGGVTTLCGYATGEEGESMAATLDRVREEGEGGCPIDFTLHAWIFEDFDYIRGIPEAVARGVTSFKVMMGYRKRGWGRCVPDDYTYAAMETAGRCGGIVLVHAENGLVVDYLENRAVATGADGAEFLRRGRPPQVEAEAVARSIHLADLAGCPLYIVHLTCREALAETRRARAEGKDVVVETCPQYLTLTEGIVDRLGSLAKVAPPLRTAEHLEVLWEGIRDGSIDTVGSDHASYTAAQKSEKSFIESPYGMPGTELLLPLLYSEGAAKGRTSLERVVQLVCENPARVLGLYPRKGALLVGSDADAVVLDPKARTAVRAAGQHTKSDYTPFEGWELSGRIEMCLVRGEVVIRDGKEVRRPSCGKFIPRERAAGRAALQPGFARKGKNRLG